MRIISPSLLAANFGRLEQEVQMLEGSAAEWLHFDVMDGLFVPNLSFGFPELKYLRGFTDKLVLDVHLMIVEPERYLERFVKTGADIVTFHYEATQDVRGCIDKIRAAGGKVGISIKPATSVDVLKEYLPFIDLVLIMSVEPGFGGQSFMEGSLSKATQLKAMIEECGADVLIEMDGGLSPKNSRAAFDAGVDVIVAGSAIFNSSDPCGEILKMLNS